MWASPISSLLCGFALYSYFTDFLFFSFDVYFFRYPNALEKLALAS
jgi:hypothetical protein